MNFLLERDYLIKFNSLLDYQFPYDQCVAAFFQAKGNVNNAVQLILDGKLNTNIIEESHIHSAQIYLDSFLEYNQRVRIKTIEASPNEYFILKFPTISQLQSIFNIVLSKNMSGIIQDKTGIPPPQNIQEYLNIFKKHKFSTDVYNILVEIYASHFYSSTPLGYSITRDKINHIYRNKYIETNILNYNISMFRYNTIQNYATYNPPFFELNNCPLADPNNTIDLISQSFFLNYFRKNVSRFKNDKIIDDFDQAVDHNKCTSIINSYFHSTTFRLENNFNEDPIELIDFLNNFYVPSSTLTSTFSLIFIDQDFIEIWNSKFSNKILNSSEYKLYAIKETNIATQVDYRITEIIQVKYNYLPHIRKYDLEFSRFQVFQPQFTRINLKELISSIKITKFNIGNLFKIKDIYKNKLNQLIKLITSDLQINQNALEFFHIHVSYCFINRLIILTIHGKYEITNEFKDVKLPDRTLLLNAVKNYKTTQFTLDSKQSNLKSIDSGNGWANLTPAEWSEHNTYVILDEHGGIYYLKKDDYTSYFPNLQSIGLFSLNILPSDDGDILVNREVLTELFPLVSQPILRL